MRYDAFISYSHAADGRVAPALQSGLHRMARKWYRLRALHVFRDQTNLGAAPQLWPRIVDALTESRALILLASPKAADSPWVAKEIEHWKTLTLPRPIYLAWTDGTLSWDASRQTFTEDSTAVPPALRDRFDGEPLWVNVTTARTEEDLSLNNPKFADVIATIGAELHGVEKNTLIGEDVRQQRTVRWLVTSTIVVLVALVIGAISLFVAEQRASQEATTQLHRAEAATREAQTQLRRATENLANQIAMNTLSEPNGDAALITTVAAVAMAETPTTVAALFTTLQRNNVAERLLHPTDQVINGLDLAMSDAGAVAIVSYENTVEVWRPPNWQRQTVEGVDAQAVAFAGERLFVLDRGQSCRLVEITPQGARAKSIPADCAFDWSESRDFAIDRNASMFAFAAGEEIVCTHGTTIACRRSTLSGSARAVAVTPDGRHIAVATHDEQTGSKVIAVHPEDGSAPARSFAQTEDVLSMTAPDPTHIAAVLASGRVISIDVFSGIETPASARFNLPKPRRSEHLIAATGPALNSIVTAEAIEGVGLPVEATLTMTSSQRLGRRYPARDRVLAVAPNAAVATAVCTSAGCNIRIGNATFAMEEPSIAAAAFSSDGALFAAASQRTLKIWRVAGGSVVLDRALDAPPTRLRFASEAKSLLVKTADGAIPIALDGKALPRVDGAGAVDVDDQGRIFAASEGSPIVVHALDAHASLPVITQKRLPPWADSDDDQADVLAVSSDGAVLVTGRSQRGEGLSTRFVLWPLAAARPALLINAFGIGPVAAGRRFVAVTDGKVRLYDRATAVPASDEFAPSFMVDRVEFAGDLLVLYGSNGDVEVITLETKELQRTACSIANRDLSPAEWDLRFSSRPYDRVCSRILGRPLGTRW